MSGTTAPGSKFATASGSTAQRLTKASTRATTSSWVTEGPEDTARIIHVSPSMPWKRIVESTSSPSGVRPVSTADHLRPETALEHLLVTGPLAEVREQILAGGFPLADTALFCDDLQLQCAISDAHCHGANFLALGIDFDAAP